MIVQDWKLHVQMEKRITWQSPSFKAFGEFAVALTPAPVWECRACVLFRVIIVCWNVHGIVALFISQLVISGWSLSFDVFTVSLPYVDLCRKALLTVLGSLLHFSVHVKRKERQHDDKSDAFVSCPTATPTSGHARLPAQRLAGAWCRPTPVPCAAPEAEAA